jgi:hypothetical protein
MADNRIVPPELLASGTDPKKLWDHRPRWLRALLLLVFVAAGILILIFMNG